MEDNVEERLATTDESRVAYNDDSKKPVPKDSPDYIPVSEKIFYGIGSLMDGGGVALMSCVMLKYMTSLGIDAWIASTIMMVAKFWDAITDPLMGFISDNTRSRYGRRRPYMFGGGICLILGLFLLFAPIKEWGMNVSGMIAYLTVMYILWNTFSTITQVPYCSMASDISPSFRERNNANTVKLVFNAVSSGISYVVPLLLLEAYTTPDTSFLPALSAVQFWIIIACVFGSMFGGGLILCSIFVKERVKDNSPKQKFKLKDFLNNYAAPMRNKSFRAHLVMYATAFMCMDIISALAVYYATDVWHGKELFGMNFSSMFIVAPLMVAAVLAFPLVRIIMDKKDKAFAFRAGLPFYILGGIMLAVMDPSWAPPVLVPIVAFIMGLGFGGAQMMPWIIFPDTVDVEEFATGNRPTGSYSGMMTLIRKIAGALGVGMVGWILTPLGYKPNETTGVYIAQSDEVLLAIRLMLGLSIAVFISIAFLMSFRFKVNNKKLARMRYFMEARKSGIYDSLSAEEKVENDALVAELYGNIKRPESCGQKGE